MTRFIPKEKMGKKALKELAKKKRVTWGISPVTRKAGSKKLYDRKKRSHDREDDYGMGVFLSRDTAGDAEPPEACGASGGLCSCSVFSRLNCLP